MAAPILWTPGKNAFFLQENLHVHKIPRFGGGGFWVWGGGGKCRFYFYGRGDFSWEKLNQGVSKPGCFPLFSGKIQIVSRTLSGLFLVGALNRPRKRKRTNPRANQENPGKIGKGQKRTKKDKKGQKKKDESRSGNPPVWNHPRLAERDFLNETICENQAIRAKRFARIGPSKIYNPMPKNVTEPNRGHSDMVRRIPWRPFQHYIYSL